MQTERLDIEGALIFRPTSHHDERGFFTRTFDTAVAAQHGIDMGALSQDSQSRSRLGVVRGMHGRSGRGEAKLVRCAHGAVLDVIVDIRPASPTFGVVASVRLDDVDFAHLYVPPGMLHGFQVLTDTADVCYRIDRPHDPAEDIGVRYDDRDLAIQWPIAEPLLSERDRAAGSFAQLRQSIGC